MHGRPRHPRHSPSTYRPSGRQLHARRSRVLLWMLAGLFVVGLTGTLPNADSGSTDPPAARGATVVADPASSSEASRPRADSPSAAGAATQEEEVGAEDEESHGPRTSHFFLVLIAILLAGKISGELAERFGQPAVLGELIGGVIVGGSVLGIVPTAAGEPMAEIVHLLAEVGVVILLFEVGLETDLKEMFRVGPAAAAVAGVGVAVPFFLGAGYWWANDPALGALPEGVSLAKVAVFVGATLTATSVGITARVLNDLDRMKTREARTIIGAAVIDDVLGLVMLAVVVGLAAGTAMTVGGITWVFAKAVGFLVLAVIIGQFIGPHLFNFVDRLRVRGMLLVSAFSFALLLAALADLSDSAMIIGSFAAGIILSGTNQFDLVVERIEPVADVFTPIFFVSVGAAVNINLVLPWSDEFDTGVLVIGGMLTLIAVIGKIVAGWAAPWEKFNNLAVGVGMIPRGEVGLIFADIGRRSGILTEGTFSAVLIMVMVSTFITPPALKWIFQREVRAAESAAEAVREPVGPGAPRSD